MWRLFIFSVPFLFVFFFPTSIYASDSLKRISRRHCEILVLQDGQGRVFTVVFGRGSLTQYHLICTKTATDNVALLDTLPS